MGSRPRKSAFWVALIDGDAGLLAGARNKLQQSGPTNPYIHSSCFVKKLSLSASVAGACSVCLRQMTEDCCQHGPSHSQAVANWAWHGQDDSKFVRKFCVRKVNLWRNVSRPACPQVVKKMHSNGDESFQEGCCLGQYTLQSKFKCPIW